MRRRSANRCRRLRFVASTLRLRFVREHLNRPMGALLMFTYLPDVLTFLTFGIVIAARRRLAEG